MSAARAPLFGVHIPQGSPVVILPTVMPEFGPHWLTSPTSHPPFVVSASSEFASLPAYYAYNGDNNNYYIGTGGGVDWLQIDVGAGRSFILGRYDIKVNNVPEPARAPKNWTMLGSNNGTTWDTLDTRTNQTAWTSGQTRSFTPAVYSTGYRYFRLSISANNGDTTFTQVQEFSLFAAPPTGQTDFSPHNLTGATGSGYTVSGSTTFDTNHPWHAFDGGLSYILSRWLGMGGGADWIKIDTGGSWLLDSYAVQTSTAGAAEPTRNPKNWTLEGSNDGSAWTVLDTVVNSTGWQISEARFFVCDVRTTRYRFFRINITANTGDVTYTQIGELYLYGS